MGGLLYKDFVSVNKIGKLRLTWGITAASMIYILLRIVFPGSAASADFMAVNEQGQEVNLLDMFFIIFFGLLVVTFVLLINGFTQKIVDGDEKNKIRGYLNAMPIGKNTYVASKYIFIGVSAYVFLSVAYIWGIACTAFCSGEYELELINKLTGFLLPIMGITILAAAIELPLFLLLGKEKAQLIKIGIWTVIALIAIGFVMFGNLTKMEKHFNIDAFVAYINHHPMQVMIFQSMVPVILLLIYYLSYCITCYFYRKKER